MSGKSARTPKSKPSPTETTASLVFDAEDFTIGELEDFEDLLGRSLFDVMKDKGTRSPREIRGIVWLLLRRDSPDLTFEDTRSVKLAELPAIFGAGSTTSATP